MSINVMMLIEHHSQRQTVAEIVLAEIRSRKRVGALQTRAGIQFIADAADHAERFPREIRHTRRRAVSRFGPAVAENKTAGKINPARGGNAGVQSKRICGESSGMIASARRNIAEKRDRSPDPKSSRNPPSCGDT